MRFPPPLTLIIEHLKKLPGIGQKSAERFAFRLLEWPTDQIEAFSSSLHNLKKNIFFCPECGALAQKNHCYYCHDTNRNVHQLCILAYPKDIFAIEETHSFKGLYHILGGLISPSHGLSLEKLNLQKLKERLVQHSFEEIILAFDSTIEGDATTLFLKKELDTSKLKISRLAFGLPVGSSLEYIDGSTLSKALTGRHGF